MSVFLYSYDERRIFKVVSCQDASKYNNFCKCAHSLSVFTKMDALGYWYVCSDCNKPIEDTYRYNSEDYLEEIMRRDN